MVGQPGDVWGSEVRYAHPQRGPKQVSDGSGRRGDEEKVFTRCPKVGWTTGEWSG